MIDSARKVFFRIIRVIVRIAPLGAFGAMAFTIGACGLGSLWNLLQLIPTFNVTALLFVLIVLGLIVRVHGFSILRFIAMITSKGASGVTGAGFITLAATLTIIPDIPIQSLAILDGIDRFMSECRALTNLVGNGVAIVVISRWEDELDRVQPHSAIAHPIELGEALETQPVKS